MKNKLLLTARLPLKLAPPLTPKPPIPADPPPPTDPWVSNFLIQSQEGKLTPTLTPPCIPSDVEAPILPFILSPTLHSDKMFPGNFKLPDSPPENSLPPNTSSGALSFPLNLSKNPPCTVAL